MSRFNKRGEAGKREREQDRSEPFLPSSLLEVVADPVKDGPRRVGPNVVEMPSTNSLTHHRNLGPRYRNGVSSRAQDMPVTRAPVYEPRPGH